MLSPIKPATRDGGVHRRDFVRVGALTGMGLGLTDFIRAQRIDAATAPKAKSCILIWLDGGPTHLETFDLKPDAPSEVKGPFQPIATVVPGTQICELMPKTARLMDQVAVIRSMTSPLGEHNFGTHYLLTGYKPSPVITYPTFGSVVAHTRQNESVLPKNIAVPRFRVGGGRQTGEGFLPQATRPFSVGGDPSKPNFSVRDLNLFPEVTTDRLDRRREFLQAFDQFGKVALDSSETSAKPDDVFEQAYRLVTSHDAKQAFDLSYETNESRNRYGRKSIGQSCLLARRLIERGVPFVTVNNPGWDTHQNAYTRLKEGYTGADNPVGLIPSLDIAFSALVEDLSERGLLDETLVVMMGEFGRTPKLNVSGGRDHWPRVFSVAMTGGGVTGGQIVGASDSVGESPKDRPVTPADLAGTIYTLLGIDPQHLLHTPDGRPIKVNRDGKVIQELFG